METKVDPVGKRLGTRFFNREAEVVSLDLIGCVSPSAPVRLTKALGITGGSNGLMATELTGLWFISPGRLSSSEQVSRTARNVNRGEHKLSHSEPSYSPKG
jgi:hypothetical protein